MNGEWHRERAAFAMAELVRDCPSSQLGLGKTDGALEALVHLCATGSDSSREQVSLPSPCFLVAYIPLVW